MQSTMQSREKLITNVLTKIKKEIIEIGESMSSPVLVEAQVPALSWTFYT